VARLISAVKQQILWLGSKFCGSQKTVVPIYNHLMAICNVQFCNCSVTCITAAHTRPLSTHDG